MKTIEEWISKVRAEYNLRECNENELSFEDDLQRATKIIEHLLGAVKFYANEEIFKFQRYNGKPGFEAGMNHFICEINGKPAWIKAQAALAAAEKEIGG